MATVFNHSYYNDEVREFNCDIQTSSETSINITSLFIFLDALGEIVCGRAFCWAILNAGRLISLGQSCTDSLRFPFAMCSTCGGFSKSGTPKMDVLNG